MSMTEEQIAALNEQIERLTEQVGYMVSAMESITRVNNTYTKSVKDAATATEDLKDSIETSSTALETEAKVKKQAEQREAANERIYASARNAVAGFADALTSGQRGFSVFSGSVTSSGEALSELTDQYGVHGQILSQLIKVTTAIINAQLTQADNLFKARVELAKFAGSVTLTTADIQKMANNMGFTVAQFSETLGRSLKTAQSGLVGLAGTAGEGAKRFAEIGDVTDDVRKNFIRMGVTPEELLESQAEYISQLRTSGSIIFANRKSNDQLQRESLKYAENLRILSEFSGKEVDALKKEQDAALAETAFRAKKIQMLDEATRLEVAGQTDRAEAIRNQVTAMDAAVQDAVGKIGSDGARLVRELFVGQLSPEMMAFVGVLPGGIEAVQKFTTDFEQMDPELAVSGLMDSLSSSLTEQISRLGPELIQVLPEENRRTLALINDMMSATITTLSREFDEDLGRILTNVETLERLREQSQRTQAGGIDTLSDAQATLITTQMNLSSGFDSLLARTNPLISGFSTTTIAATTLAGAAAIAAMQLAKIGAGSVLNRFGGGSGGGGGTDLSMGTRGARALSGLKTGGLLAALGVATEAYSGLQTHQQIDRQREQGLITEQEAEEQQSRNIKTTGGRAVGATTGALVGGAVGQALIPLPVVGAMIGSSIGSMLGTAAGEWAGDYFADKAEAAQEESATRTQTPRTRTPRTPPSPNVPRLEVSETNATGGTQTNVSTVPPTAVTQQTRIENREQHELLSTMVSEMRDMNYKLDQLNYTNLTLSRILAS